MKLRTLLIVCCVMLIAGATGAQPAKTDVVSGTWTGSMGPNDTERHPITVTLKFDGKNVSGTITGPPSPGKIDKGTYDAASGALKFEVVVQDESKTVVSFAGKVVKDTAAGTVTFKDGGKQGTFTLKKAEKAK
jgi:hypothetical protein